MHKRRYFFPALATLLIGFAALPASAQYVYNPEHRRPVEATLHNLREIAEHNTYTGHEHERYANALHHLEQFAERLHEGGFFDKAKLDQAIGDIQSVIDHNPMDPRARDILIRDDNELRRLREHYDQRYRYPY
jgi:hypothetical protein